MRSAAKLLTIHGEHPPVSTLVHAFSGFVDAGAGVRQAAAQIKDSCDTHLVASFDIDELVDYRARRPRMTFSSDHFSSVDTPAITVSRVLDDNGRAFLLLDGPEPDYQWNRFLAAVDIVIDTFEVTHAVGLSAIPWPAPHTRPLGVTVHGNDPELIAGRSAVLGDIEVPGHMGALLEYHLGQRGLSSVGVTAQVPHYLVQFDYPRCAMVLLEGLADATGLSLSAVALEESAHKAEGEVAEQLSGNEEFAAVVSALEAQYDQMSEARNALTKPSSAPQGEVPSGEEIAAQVEEFLAGLGDDSEKEDKSGGDEPGGR
ncbi:MAG TPA: PAC2 family protein [Candidatus Nanopelagicales bacterium]|nr:PAC2 family protein [Candidatus Nanopelagicales bacterium]